MLCFHFHVRQYCHCNRYNTFYISSHITSVIKRFVRTKPRNTFLRSTSLVSGYLSVILICVLAALFSFLICIGCALSRLCLLSISVTMVFIIVFHIEQSSQLASRFIINDLLTYLSTYLLKTTYLCFNSRQNFTGSYV